MSRVDVRSRVDEALPLGVKEFYFTGGEPFLHPEMLEILEDTLAHGPGTVLTNGTLFTPPRLERLRAMGDASRYALELRVSLDGYRAEDHDAIRGAGAFARTLEGLRQCEAYGLLPIVTMTQNTDDCSECIPRSEMPGILTGVILVATRQHKPGYPVLVHNFFVRHQSRSERSFAMG